MINITTERKRLTESLETLTGVPDYMHEGIVEYILTGRPTGHYLEAVMSNDLFGAVARADIPNQRTLVDLVRWLVNHAPAGCFGSPTAYARWREMGGQVGLTTDPAVMADRLMALRDPSVLAVLTVTDAEQRDARQALVYEKALKLTRRIARSTYTEARMDVVPFVDEARVIEREAQAAWPGKAATDGP